MPHDVLVGFAIIAVVLFVFALVVTVTQPPRR
jgi:hypothetical protein